MQLKVGSRLQSAVCDTQVVVVRAPKDDVDLRCGGHSLLATGASAPTGISLDPALSGGSLMGKRYADEALGLEVLVSKAGRGTLSLGTTPLGLKEAKPLPSSD